MTKIIEKVFLAIRVETQGREPHFYCEYPDTGSPRVVLWGKGDQHHAQKALNVLKANYVRAQIIHVQVTQTTSET